MRVASAILASALALTTVSLVAQIRPSVTVDDTTHTTFWLDGAWTWVHVESRGAVEFSDDGRDVTSVSPNGSFTVSTRGWLSLFGRRYVVRGNPDGTVSRQYSVGAVEHPIDSIARQWIGDAIVHLADNGFGADGRVSRILAERGPAAVLSETSRLSTDYAKARYLSALIAQAPLSNEMVERTMGQASRDIGSDFEKSRVLRMVVDRFPFDDALAAAFGRAASAIGSDFEHARVLVSAIERQTHTPSVVRAVIASSAGIGSDFEKARVLRALAGQGDLPADAVPVLVVTTRSIGSDFEKSRVLLEVISRQPIEGGTRQALLDSAGAIGSDFERGRIFTAMMRQGVR